MKDHADFGSEQAKEAHLKTGRLTTADWIRAARLADMLAPQEGSQPCGVDGVTLVRHNHDRVNFPVVYGPSLVFLVQGTKKASFGSTIYTYGHDRYIVLASMLPFVCSSFTEHGKPVLSVFVHLRADVVLELLGGMTSAVTQEWDEELTMFEAHDMTSEIEYALLRLLEAATHERDSKVLGPSIIRELVYRALNGPGGTSIRASLGSDGHFAQITKAIRHVRKNIAKPMSVPDLAENVGMSPSVFYLYFKRVTQSTPLQYIKNLRLQLGRSLMIAEGLTVAEAADRAGYENYSQFSREYKRLFGDAPAIDAGRLRSDQS